MYKLTWSPRERQSHEKHGERSIEEEILETFIIDGGKEDLREHDKPILVVDISKEWFNNYRKEGLALRNLMNEWFYSEEEHAVRKKDFWGNLILP